MNIKTIQAIETPYKGYKFRSRLEARWAVFMDTAGINWGYETEGFETDAGRYLPDFRLTDFELWLEIKPAPELVEKIDIDRAAELGSVLVLTGNPWLNEYRFWQPNRDRGLISRTEFWGRCCLCGRVSPLTVGLSGCGTEGVICDACDIYKRDEADHPGDFIASADCYFHKGFSVAPCGWDWVSDLVRDSFNAARSARFEQVKLREGYSPRSVIPSKRDMSDGEFLAILRKKRHEQGIADPGCNCDQCHRIRAAGKDTKP